MSHSKIFDHAKLYFPAHVTLENCFLCGQSRYGCSLEVLYENLESGDIIEEEVCGDCIEIGKIEEYRRKM